MSTEMNSPPANRSREVAQRLLQKNIELDEARKKAAKMKIPSDPNTWAQMRDNFESIILEDHDFSEKHGIEYSLWQLHHKKIDEYRSHLSASQNGKLPSRPDRAKKIFSSFKGFLSEASGFYHDLILKIRSKYGLPLGLFSEGIESEDTKKSSNMKKALLSCHRCLIFLGDLARYKGMYGEGESSARDYAAASSYYLQAASLWPSSGNPHHQLAILSICTDESEVTTIYRYFRSLAVQNPLLTARDNLVVAFEKNRQKCSQLSDLRTNSPKIKMNVRRRAHSGTPTKSVDTEENNGSERERNASEVFNAFSLRFVRLNGILYTRTSLETFSEILSSALSDLSELLSTGPEENTNFGSDTSDNKMFFLKLTAILIFSVYNINKESESQSYAGILQRSILLQNAITATFEFMGLITKRCTELHDCTASYLLPSILAFVEWLACNPNMVSVVDAEEREALARSAFWMHFVSLMNRLSLTGLGIPNGDEDSCFFDMGRYDEGETENRLALMEDIELRGFVPLVPAQVILKFSGNYSYVSAKEKKSRVQRILAAGKVLTNLVSVDQKKIYFDIKSKRYVLTEHPPIHEDETLESKVQVSSEGEEDEVILFKPSNVLDLSKDYDVMQPMAPPPQSYSINWESYLRPQFSSPLVEIPKSSDPLPALHVDPNPKWGGNQDVLFPQEIQNLRISDMGMWGGFSSAPFSMPAVSDLVNPVVPSVVSSSSRVSATSWRAPVGRPVRHLGPPPGFSSVPSKQKPVEEPKEQNALVDDYSWLDGYSSGNNGSVNGNSIIGNLPQQVSSSSAGNSNNPDGALNFPFPGKQHQSLWSNYYV